MATTRGFVERIEIGRAGLARIRLVHDDGGTADYVIRDLDADPERFNERLSRLGILRDAMNRAEPVEVEFTTGEGGNVIDRAARITRDELGPVLGADQLAGLVLDVDVTARNRTGTAAEEPDEARVTLLTTSLQPVVLRLPLQAPERLVAQRQVEMLLWAQAEGRVARLIVDRSRGGADTRVVSVAVDNSATTFGDRDTRPLDGFVESLSLLRVPLAGVPPLASTFAHVRFTTAPPFTGAGNTVGLTPFTPTTVDLLVPKQSLTYELFEAGLRDNLRMRTAAAFFEGRDRQIPEEEPRRDTAPESHDMRDEGSVEGDLSHVPVARVMARSVAVEAERATGEGAFGVAIAAELLAPLASASRPVWITISRTSLDRGPEEEACTPGVPSHDLRPSTLRDLRLPYPAKWTGLACFNPGVYRFQFRLPSPFELLVDGEELCLHDSEEAGVKLAHACLHGEHEVSVVLEAWRCDDEFQMDVYRIR